MTIYSDRNFCALQSDLQASIHATIVEFAKKNRLAYRPQDLNQMVTQPASIASEFLRFGMNVWPEAAAEEGDVIVHQHPGLPPRVSAFRRVVQIAACLTIVVGISLFMVFMGEAPVISKESLEHRYLRHGPQSVERIWIEPDGRIRLVKVRHLDQARNSVVVKIMESHLIAQSQIEDETDRIWANALIR